MHACSYPTFLTLLTRAQCVHGVTYFYPPRRRGSHCRTDSDRLTVWLSSTLPDGLSVAVTVTGPVCTVVLFFVRRLEGLSACCIACQLSRPAHRLQLVFLLQRRQFVCSRPISTRAKLRHTQGHTPHLTPNVGPMQPPTRVLRRTACAVIMKTLMAAQSSICDGPPSLASQRSPTDVKVQCAGIADESSAFERSERATVSVLREP
jgi:hypothetical protein